MILTVPELEGQELKKPTSVANDESKRWRGGKGEQVRIDERVNAAYSYILDGGTRRQIAEKLATRFNTSVRTAHDDYAKAMILLREEQSATRQDLLNQIQALRLATVTKALRKGQLQTVAMLLKDMGAVIGEAAPEQLAQAAPQLNITIDDKRNG